MQKNISKPDYKKVIKRIGYLLHLGKPQFEIICESEALVETNVIHSPERQHKLHQKNYLNTTLIYTFKSAV